VLGERNRITAAGRPFDVRYTPGHASHHVSYFDDGNGIAWAGDTAGLRFTPQVVFTIPPTPPPDIDLDAWRESIAKLRAWWPQTVFITHFGPYTGVPEHLDHLEKSLTDFGAMAKRALESDLSDEAKYQRFKADVENYVRLGGVTDADVAPLEHVGPLEFNWRGLARYWKKRGLRGY
jgi:glyoxylase-like metal-dependent hydrolase (beta-lactamase superfamily II)